ncbi:MAG: hypothetical protein AAGA85_19305, partial [Bacteroidota bacterium]
MTKRSISLLLALALVGGCCQETSKLVEVSTYNQSLTASQIKEDFDVLVTTLKTNHPGLYDYQNEDDFQSLTKSLENKILSAANVLDVYGIVSRLIAAVGDAHTYAINPYYQNILEEELLFPIIPQIDKNQITIEGKRLKSINGNPEEQILTRLQSFANSDGKTIPYKNAFIEMEFPVK